jgi:hypothetical protein
MKLVVNRSVGARFAISAKAARRLFELKGPTALTRVGTQPEQLFCSLPRNDKDFVQVVEELGIGASDYDAELTVVEIPDNANWGISDIFGYEYVMVDGEQWIP